MPDALLTNGIVVEATRAEIFHAASLLARAPEEAGYSDLDLPTAKSILAFDMPTDRQIRSLWTILGRYADQLTGLGVDYSSLVPPPVPGSPEAGRTPIKIVTEQGSSPVEKKKSDKTVYLGLSKNKEWVTVAFKFHPKLYEVVEKLPNRRFDKEGTRGGMPKSWLIGMDPTSIEAAIAAFRAIGPEVVIELSGEVSAILEQGKRSYVESRAESADIVVPTKLDLYPFQKAGVKGIDDRNGRVLLADEMGVGKTIQSLGWMALRREKALPALVVCKAMLKGNWVNETTKCTDFKCLIMAGENSVGQFKKRGYNASTSTETGYDLTIVNYDLLSTESPKTWLKMLLNDDKEEALKKKLAALEQEKEDKEAELVKAKILSVQEERKYGARELVKAGKQSVDLLETAMESREGLSSRNRIWKILERIKGDKNALSENGEEYLRYFVNNKPLEDFMKMGWKTLIFDESHQIKEVSAQRTMVALRMSKEIPHVMCLTGTPILNRPKELWSQTQLVAPLLFPSFFNYGKEFCGAFQKPTGSYRCQVCKGSGKASPDLIAKTRKTNPDGLCEACNGEGRIIKKAWVFNGTSNLDKLEKTLRSTIMIRRMKEQVLKELPKKTRTMLPFLIEEKDERLYKKNSLGPMQRLTKLKKERDEWRAATEKMTDEERRKFIAEHAEKAANAHRLTGLILEDIEKIKQAAVDARYEESLSFILDVHEQEGKILAFASHHATIDRLVASLAKEGIRVAAIDGRVDAGKREDIKKSFQVGDLEVLVCGIRAAAEGLTLTAAHIVVMMEMDWHPGIHAQAEDRVHRIGQSMPVTVYYLIAMGTVEEKIAKMVDAKREVMNATLGEGHRTLSEDGILDAVLDEIVERAA